MHPASLLVSLHSCKAGHATIGLDPVNDAAYWILKVVAELSRLLCKLVWQCRAWHQHSGNVLAV